MKCKKCKSKNITAWNQGDYICNDCRYSSLYNEIMSVEEYKKWLMTK